MNAEDPLYSFFTILGLIAALVVMVKLISGKGFIGITADMMAKLGAEVVKFISERIAMII